MAFLASLQENDEVVISEFVLLELYGLESDPTLLNYSINTRTNGGDAKIQGIEFSYRQSLTFLPGRVVIAGGALLLAACTSDPSVASGPDAVARSAATASAKGASQADVNRDLAALRTAMARFHDFEFARDSAGYNFLFMDMCMVDESPAKAGGMGLHYVNLGILDTDLDVTKPEALLYEPGPSGKPVLVAVEYAIPAELWKKTTPPMLFGQELKVNSFGLYALHVWAWKNNPSGTFASWNPRVSCENWTDAKVGGHH